MDHLHQLEKKVYKRSVEFYFDSINSCLVLDSEMIGSKVADGKLNWLVMGKLLGGKTNL